MCGSRPCASAAAAGPPNNDRAVARDYDGKGAVERQMKPHLSRINPLAVCCAMAATLAIAYGIWGYLDYFVPADFGCSGDPACIAEITAERRADFLVVNVGMLF